MRTVMLTDYIRAAMRQARYQILADDDTYYGEIPGLQGVWANATSLEACRDELQQVLEEWIVLGLSRQHPLPAIGGIELTIKDVA
jgi:predicted RNase H-like HicB family nuclease